MAYTTIDDPSEYFHTRLYSGNGSTQSITNDANAGDFKPDWLWIKERTSTSQHFLFDSTRGVGKYLHSDSTSLEGNDVHNTSFDSNGFGVGQQNGTNENSQTYVAWQWKANGGTTSSNSDGSITSTVQANTTAGFSIVTYTGNGTSGATIGHGLNSAPEWTIIKRRSDTEAWPVWHTAFGSAQSNVRLNGTDVVDTSSSGMFNNTFPTSSLITLGNGNFVNTNTETYVAYCFSEVKGYSKFGSYTADGNVDGPFVYTGFKPAWVMFKQTNSSDTAHWFMYDSTRSPTNVIGDVGLAANLSNAEGLGSTWNPNTSDSVVDFVSNGFKIRTTATSGFNISGNTMIYMAFAEHPFVSSKGVPVTAR